MLFTNRQNDGQSLRGVQAFFVGGGGGGGSNSDQKDTLCKIAIFLWSEITWNNFFMGKDQ